MIQHPWLLALQQRLSQYPFELSQVLTVPLPVRRLVEGGLGRYGVLVLSQPRYKSHSHQLYRNQYQNPLN